MARGWKEHECVPIQNYEDLIIESKATCDEVHTDDKVSRGDCRFLSEKFLLKILNPLLEGDVRTTILEAHQFSDNHIRRMRAYAREKDEPREGWAKRRDHRLQAIKELDDRLWSTIISTLECHCPCTVRPERLLTESPELTGADLGIHAWTYGSRPWYNEETGRSRPGWTRGDKGESRGNG